MSRLTVYHQSTPDIPNKVLSHAEDITATLAELGIGFERAPATFPIDAQASQEEVIATYRGEIDGWIGRGAYLGLDVLSVDENHPHKVRHRGELNREHRLQGPWAFCLVAGRALLSVHVGDYVYAVLCERNDRVVLPAETAHWLDIGEHPRVVAIRLFTDAQGWRPVYVEASVSARFPALDD